MDAIEASLEFSNQILVDNPQVSATEPDWSREKCSRWWEPSRQLLKSIRRYQKWQAQGGILGRFFSAMNVIQH